MRKVLSITATVLAGTLALAGCAPQEPVALESQTTTEATQAEVEPEAMFDEVVGELEVGPATEDETALLLSYLIEEEKLAHDVYTVLYEEYGSQVFGNILESETKHQDQVLTLLDTYGIEDPRADELGVFNDPELQELYDTLIAKGMLSETDAFEVGVMIEEKDIADITYQLENASEEDVIDTLERLRSGSENHLRAFNKQL
jgi:hypothetical protein